MKNKNRVMPSASIKECTKHLNKKGVLKGKNKKMTKHLKNICCHHRLTKKNNIIETYVMKESKDGVPYCVCTQCGAKFLAGFYEPQESKQIIGETKKLIENCKFLAVAVNSNPAVVDRLGAINDSMDYLTKTSKKLTNVAKARENCKKQNKKKNRTDYNVYGNWGSRR